MLVQNYEETVDEETRLKRIMIKQNAHLFAAIKFGLFAAQVTIVNIF